MIDFQALKSIISPYPIKKKYDIQGFIRLDMTEAGKKKTERKKRVAGSMPKKSEFPLLVQPKERVDCQLPGLMVNKIELLPQVEITQKLVERPSTSPIKKPLFQAQSPPKTHKRPAKKKQQPKPATSAVQLVKVPDTEDTTRKKLGFENQKVFILDGNYPSVRSALQARDWVENKDSDSSAFYDLLWTRNPRVPDNLKDWQYINHFERNHELCLKANLGDNLSKLIQLFNVNPRYFYPRTFRVLEKLPDEFVDRFKLIHAAGLLKEFVNDGEVGIEVALTCCLVCNRWAGDLETSKREDRTGLVMNLEWRLITSKSPEEIAYLYSKVLLPQRPQCREEAVKIASATLQRLKGADPQFGINGKNDIWIVKHGFKSRGRDIILHDNIDKIRSLTENSSNWIIQKYIENPLVIQDRKFDIRQWVLVTCADPLTIYIYKDCYLRFSAEEWRLDSLNNKFVHLTNNSIAKNSKQFQQSDIEGCMWHVETFKEYLLENFGRNVWDDSIFPRIKNIVRWSLQSVGRLGFRKAKSFEVFGYDFMIDASLNTWLLEVNSSPSMDYSTKITESLVKNMLNDAVKVVIDQDESSDTGNFMLLYKSTAKYKNY